VLTQQDCDISDEWNEANYASNDIFFAVQEGLARGVELGVVRDIVIALGEQAEGCFAANMLARIHACRPMESRKLRPSRSQHLPQEQERHWEVDSPSTVSPHHAMHDRNILALDVVHHDLTHLCIQPPIPQEQQISSLEGRLHGS
jgi:hypothetical protein